MMTENPVLLLDGGLSTALEARGHAVGGILWTGDLLMSDPDAVAQAHRDFVEGGADVLITGSYQLSFDGCRSAGWDEADTIRALHNSTSAARMAADEGTLVAASVGPYGASLSDGSEFRGAYGVSRSTLLDFHARRLEVLLETEPDLLAIETQPDLDEIDVILSLVSERAPDMPLWVSCTVTEPGRIAGGAPWGEVVTRVAELESAVAVGINCSSIEFIAPTLESIDSPVPYVVYPNHGKQWDAASDTWQGSGNDLSEAHVSRWISAGAILIGGCCGFGASDISSLRKWV
jgi:homocysteine S-methyltransferase